MNKRAILACQLRRTHHRFSCNFSSNSTPAVELSTCIAWLQSCAQNQELWQGRKIHAHIVSCGHLNSALSSTSLINMYAKCSSIDDALSVFYESTHVHNVFVYNSIIAGLTINDMPTEAFGLYCKMRLLGVAPDKFTFPCVIKACPDFLGLRNVHGLLFKHGLKFDLFIGSALVHGYLKFGLINEAVEVFDRLTERDDIVLWNAMINGYVHIGELGKALMVFRRLADYGVKTNKFTITGVLSALALTGEVDNGKVIHAFAIKMGYDLGIAVSNALIDMYGKCRQLADALTVFESGIEKDIYSWNSIISVYQQCGDNDGALRLLKGMLSSKFQPDLVTVTAALPACSHLALLTHGREIHGYMILCGLIKACSTYIENAVMDMYAKCGSMREAHLVFDKIKVKDVASWNILVMGYGMHGYGNEALDLFYRMCEFGLKPDEISFVGVLAACSHAGFVGQGQELLAEMLPQYGIAPAIEHYACVIDMLGRAGQLEGAFKLLSNMPIKPNQVVWRTFLGACRLYGNANLAEVAAQQVLELDPKHCGNYVLMSNVYGEGGRYEEVANLRKTMKQQDVKKSPGCSWIELGSGMHVFFTGDRTHPDASMVYEGLDLLTTCLSERGCMLDAMESCL
ncbi:pentatricopeptide repeat-containing protein-like [Dorcoceras hygrometricum]|uniref:Pentatricopeptide repeat-containing protein-like n=1 Tax=Dorcoceras hygrometricum TaxID=472368 RepID=A0A2Z7AKW6_9LAMI|nr:pentatricopeptide repeat-containing protein-like [Dorcoceras hygrometricum]